MRYATYRLNTWIPGSHGRLARGPPSGMDLIVADRLDRGGIILPAALADDPAAIQVCRDLVEGSPAPPHVADLRDDDLLLIHLDQLAVQARVAQGDVMAIDLAIGFLMLHQDGRRRLVDAANLVQVFGEPSPPGAPRPAGGILRPITSATRMPACRPNYAPPGQRLIMCAPPPGRG
jgi:hypothetical protein